MEKRFRLLGILSMLFKILSFVVIALFGIVCIRVATGGIHPQQGRALSFLLNTSFRFLISATILYALGEVIRILRVIEEQTRKP